MDELEKHHDNIIEQKIVDFAPPDNVEGNSGEMLAGILRRWYIVLLIFFVIVGAGLPAIWLLIKPVYVVNGTIEVAPILRNPLTGEADTGEISNYQSFMLTQASLVTIDSVLQRVADDLAGANLDFFKKPATDWVTKLKQRIDHTTTSTEPASILRQAISDGTIQVAPGGKTQMLNITMSSTNADEAKKIVNSFIDSYMAYSGSASSQSEDQNLNLLESERTRLEARIKQHRDRKRDLGQEYGSTNLGERYDVKLTNRVAMLLAEKTKAEVRRIALDAKVALFKNMPKQTIPPQDVLRMKNEYINNDTTLKQLTQQVMQLEQDLMIAKQTLGPKNPLLQQKQSILESFQGQLEKKRQQLGDDFDKTIAQANANTENKEKQKIETELAEVLAYEQKLNEVLDKEDTQTINIGKKQLDIEELNYQLGLDQQYYDTVCRRLKELEMERKRPARVTVGYRAQFVEIRDKRTKYSAAIVILGLAAGMMLAFLRDKADQKLYNPNDVTKRIGIRIIGTTTSPNAVRKALLPKQVTEDYQTIRANLGLLNGKGIPAKLVVTSPGMREGKTTLAINLATSIAKSGKKVLLIDGDLRKPDIARLLNLPKGIRGLQDLLFGKNGQLAIHNIPSTGLDVLAADSRNRSDAYELLALPATAQRIDAISRNYDHIIIDTPPVLAFPDALIWAKMADAVLLTSFAGQTTTGDLMETRQKLAQINVNVLGTVLTNVPLAHSYYRYGYSYYAQDGRRKSRATRAGRKLLLPTESTREDKEKS